MVLNEVKLSKLFIVSAFVLMFTGIISLISVKFELEMLRIWKEILIIFLFLGTLFFSYISKVNIIRVFLFCLFVCLFFLVYFLIFINTNRTLVFYQIKNDIIPFLFPISIIIGLSTRDGVSYFIKNYVKCIVNITLINAILIFIQTIYTESFLLYLEIDSYNNQGSASGLRLDHTLGSLRAMGTMTSFINSGTLCLFSIFILIETKYYSGFKKWFFIGVITLAAIATTYKTIYIALILYLLIRLTYLLLKNDLHQRVFLFFMTIFCFCFFSFTFNNMYIYDNYFRGTDYQEIGYDSIYIRVLQHDMIISDMEKQGSFYTGQGVGYNGTEGPSELKSNSKALDSTFINILSNYGAIFTFGFIIILFMLQLYFTLRRGVLNNLACIILFYIIGVEFFANNFFMNFPPNIIFYTLIAISYLAIKYKVTLNR